MDHEGFDLNLIVAFNAMMEERHVTRAARRIGLSQPAMSAALARLRKLTRDELFVRSANGFAPTPRAIDIAKPLRHALDTVTQALNIDDVFDPLTSKQVFTIAVADHPTHVLLPVLAARIAEFAPRIDLRARNFRDRRDAIALLDEGSVDAAIGVSVGNESRILHEPLFEERFVGVARAGEDNVAHFSSLEAFVAATHILVSPEGDDAGIVDAALAKVGHSRRIGLTVTAMYAAPALVQATNYIAVLMEGVVKTAYGEVLSVYPLPISLETIGFNLLWHRRTDKHPAHQWLREQIRQASPR